MKRPTVLFLVTLTAAHAFHVPNPKQIKTDLAKGAAVVATSVALLSPLTANAADDATTTFKVDINAPYLIQLVKTQEARTNTVDRIEFLADSIKDFLGPAVNIELPTDIRGVAKNALSGRAALSVNGQDVTVHVVESTQGALTVQLSNKLIPAIPFAGLKNTPAPINAAADVAADAAASVVPRVVNAVAGRSASSSTAAPFWERPIFNGKIRLNVGEIDKAITPIDVLGGGSLGLGVAYGASFGYYTYSRQQDEKAATKKKAAIAAKKGAKKNKAPAAVKKNKAPAAAIEEQNEVEQQPIAVVEEKKGTLKKIFSR